MMLLVSGNDYGKPSRATWTNFRFVTVRNIAETKYTICGNPRSFGFLNGAKYVTKTYCSLKKTD